MKKRFLIILLIFIVLISLVIGYFVSYKDVDEIKKLLSKSESITNMYVEHYVNYGEYINNVKDYRTYIYIKDNVYVYDVLGRIDYINYNTNECFTMDSNMNKSEVDIKFVNKFNDFSTYLDPTLYTYSYIYPCYVKGVWCDKIKLKENNGNFKLVLYINKENGLVMKQEKIFDNFKGIETFDYQMNIVTEEQIKEIV